MTPTRPSGMLQTRQSGTKYSLRDIQGVCYIQRPIGHSDMGYFRQNSPYGE